MFNKLRANYNLSNVLVRIAFVLAFVFCNWQRFLGVAYNMSFQSITGGTLDINGVGVLLLSLFSAALMGAVLMFLIPFLADVFLNLAKIHSVPRAEYRLLLLLFFTIGFFANGLLNLINLATPLLLVWGGVLFPFVVSVCCCFAFYKVTVRLYFNDVTVVNYFKYYVVVSAALIFFLEIL